MSDPKPKCQCCEAETSDVKRRRQNTNYVEEDSNYAVLCDPCQKEADAYWADMWASYYSGCL